jgi:hypothetical protein
MRIAMSAKCQESTKCSGRLTPESYMPFSRRGAERFPTLLDFLTETTKAVRLLPS